MRLFKFAIIGMLLFALPAQAELTEKDLRVIADLIRQAQPAPPPATPAGSFGNENFNETWSRDKQDIPRYTLTDATPSSNNASSTTEKAFDFNVDEFKKLVQKEIIDSYLMYDGSAMDDTIDLSLLPITGKVRIRTNTKKEMDEVIKALDYYYGETKLSELPAIDQRTQKNIPADQLATSTFVPDFTIQDLAPAIIEEFKKNNKLAPNEYINWDRQTTVAEYSLRKDRVTKLTEDLSLMRRTHRLSFTPEMAIKKLRDRLGLLNMNGFEEVDFDESSNTVFYTLRDRNRLEFEASMYFYDRRPWSVVAEAKILSVSNDLQQELGAVFEYSGKHGKSTQSLASDLAAAGLNLSLGYQNFKDLVSATINALTTSGLGKRYNVPEQRTLEIFSEADAVEFKKKTTIPVVNTFENGSTTQLVDVGLGFVINKLQVIEPQAIRSAYNDLRARLHQWRTNPENAQFIRDTNALFHQGVFHKMELSELDRIVREEKAFQEEFASISNKLEIHLEAVVEDGGILRLIESGAGVAPEYESITYKTRQILKSGQPVFMGGTNEKETRETERKVPFLGDIPVIGNLFKYKANERDQDSLVSFLTVTVLDNNTVDSIKQRQVIGKYGRIGQRIGIPISLGGLSPDNVDPRPLGTGVRSELQFMYDGVGDHKPLFYQAKDKFPAGSPFGRRLVGAIFEKEVVHNIELTGVTSEVEWADFKLMSRYIDRLHGYAQDGESGHPFIKAMRRIQENVKTFSGLDFTLTELMALIRSEGQVGRYLWPEYRADERLYLYMLYLIAREDSSERQVFATDAALDDFQKKMPKLLKCFDKEKFEDCENIIDKIDNNIAEELEKIEATVRDDFTTYSRSETSESNKQNRVSYSSSTQDEGDNTRNQPRFGMGSK